MTPESEQIKALESLLAALGGEKREGEWFFPAVYMRSGEFKRLMARVGAEKRDDEPLMLPTAEWIEARKAAARALMSGIGLSIGRLSRSGLPNCDDTSGEVLPDLDGQNLTD